MRYALVATLLLALTCVGCGSSPTDRDGEPSSESAEVSGEDFTLNGTLTDGTKPDDSTDTATGGDFALSGHLEPVGATRVYNGGGWELTLKTGSPTLK